MNDNTCGYRWVDESDPSVGYEGGYILTTCKREIDMDELRDDWVHCPFCGKKIACDSNIWWWNHEQA